MRASLEKMVPHVQRSFIRRSAALDTKIPQQETNCRRDLVGILRNQINEEILKSEETRLKSQLKSFKKESSKLRNRALLLLAVAVALAIAKLLGYCICFQYFSRVLTPEAQLFHESIRISPQVELAEQSMQILKDQNLMGGIFQKNHEHFQ